MSTSAEQHDAATVEPASTAQASVDPSALAMAQLLKDNTMLLSTSSIKHLANVAPASSRAQELTDLVELDIDTLKDVLSRHFPGQEAKILYEQMVSQLSFYLPECCYGGEVGDGMYLSTPNHLESFRGQEEPFGVMPVFFEHVKHLRTLSGNELYSVTVAITLMQRIINNDYDHLSEEDLVVLCKMFDDVMLGNIESIFGYKEEHDKYSKVVCAMEHILAAHKEAGREIRGMWEVYLAGNPTFQRSMIAIANWHSERVGAMLSLKVAGDVLPLELCEMISDFYALERAQKRVKALARKERIMRRSMQDEDGLSEESEDSDSEDDGSYED